MNADRHALLAALEYSAKQDQEIKLLNDTTHVMQQENRGLRHRLREARASLDGRDKDTAPACEASMPMDMGPGSMPSYRPCDCKCHERP